MVRCRGSRQRQSPGTPLIRPGIPGSRDPNIPSIHYISTPSFLWRLRAQSRFSELPREACTRRARYLPDVVFFPTFYCTRGPVDATTCPSTSISYAPGAPDNDPCLDFTLASNKTSPETGPQFGGVGVFSSSACRMSASLLDIRQRLGGLNPSDGEYRRLLRELLSHQDLRSHIRDLQGSGLRVFVELLDNVRKIGIRSIASDFP